jgi:hypothetical protein
VKEEEEVEGAKAQAVSSIDKDCHGESELRSSHPHISKENLRLPDSMIIAASIV